MTTVTHRTAVILVVGLNQELLRHAPRISGFAAGGAVRRVTPPFPAVTCTVQSSMLTGRPVREHGIVGNGWYNREAAEVQFWKQSNRLVQGEKVWHEARRRDAAFTCAKLFWWYNMYAGVEFSVTPRPIYKADGRKIPDVYTHPPDLRERLRQRLGAFPLFKFWGPGSSIESTRWITDSALAVEEWHTPSLSLVYLPHMDYSLQRVGPEHASIAAEVNAVDVEVGRLLDAYGRAGVRCMVLGEYGIEPVTGPVHINRALREAGLCRVRVEDGLEVLDAGASEAFAVADHQVAHVYVRRPETIGAVAAVCSSLDGVGGVFDREAQRGKAIDHERSGELVLVAAPGRWFTYYYWLDDAVAPDFARTVDIHRKPGYDPVELFLDPRFNRFGVGLKLLKRKMGLRTLLDVIPLDASLVRGSHGRCDLPEHRQPILVTSSASDASRGPLSSEQVFGVILDHLFEDR